MDRAEVVITVLNENDMNPVFQHKSYEFTVKWSEGAAVGRVKVSN